MTRGATRRNVAANWIWFGIDVLFAISLSVHILMHKRDSRAAALWIALVWFVPVAGFVLYWSFGVNRIARKARKHRPSEGRPGAELHANVPVELQPLKRVGNGLTGNRLVGGNGIDMLVDGDQAYPAMISAIDGARETVGMCSYIFDDDTVGQSFVEALCRAAKRGVQVRLLVDGIGAIGFGPLLRRRIHDSGGRVSAFWPRGRWLKHPGINLRNHRKILVVDGVTAFTGGLNVSDRHGTRPDESSPESRDAHFRIRGPVVRHLVETFADDWELATGESLDLSMWCAEPGAAGDVTARGIACGPDQDLGRVYALLLGALRTARDRIDLMSPYFIPDAAILGALTTASLAGVRVRLLLPRQTDHMFMLWAARAYLWELVERGIEVWEIGPGFVHSKLTVVDGQWVLFGSSNLDARSFRLNFEFNVETYSPDLAGRVLEYMEGFLPTARHITLRELRRESYLERLRNQAVKLFSPFL